MFGESDSDDDDPMLLYNDYESEEEEDPATKVITNSTHYWPLQYEALT